MELYDPILDPIVDRQTQSSAAALGCATPTAAPTASASDDYLCSPVVRQLPPLVRFVLKALPSKAVVAGGYHSAALDGRTPKDIDIFVPDVRGLRFGFESSPTWKSNDAHQGEYPEF